MKNSRWLSLIVLCTGFLLIVVDMTIVNVALPSVQKDLAFSQSGLAWVINAYLIAFGGLLLLAGRIGDLVGRKRVYLVGLAIFVGASLLCGLSFDQPMLIAARFVQGIGGAVSSAVILAMIVMLFPEPLDRAKAFGVFSFVASAGAAIGLIAGGLITQAVSWHWIFFVNLPIGIATAVAAARLLEADKGLGLGIDPTIYTLADLTAHPLDTRQSEGQQVRSLQFSLERLRHVGVDKATARIVDITWEVIVRARRVVIEQIVDTDCDLGAVDPGVPVRTAIPECHHKRGEPMPQRRLPDAPGRSLHRPAGASWAPLPVRRRPAND